ncbi:MAG: hypothetical protein AB1733_22085 [Thermodesulfobacteriota bacterium]
MTHDKTSAAVAAFDSAPAAGQLWAICWASWSRRDFLLMLGMIPLTPALRLAFHGRESLLSRKPALFAKKVSGVAPTGQCSAEA